MHWRKISKIYNGRKYIHLKSQFKRGYNRRDDYFRIKINSKNKRREKWGKKRNIWNLKIIDKIKNKLKVNGFLLKEGKLIDKQTKVRRTLEVMNKWQASIFVLGIELIEDLEYEIKQKIKTKSGRPRKENNINNEINYNKKIDCYLSDKKMDLD